MKRRKATILKKFISIGIYILVLLILTTTSVLSKPYWEGKKLMVLCGSAPGGRYDAYSRLIARHLPKQLPGKPIAIVKNLPAPTLPKINGFSVYSSGRSQNISFVNGVVSTSLVYNYVLSPRSVGKYKIDSVILKYKNREYKTDPISVEVVTAKQTIPEKSSQTDQSNKNAKGLFASAYAK